MNSTPRWASEAAPGRTWVDPPPTMAATEAVWWGAWNGGRVTSGEPAGRVPATECTAVTSIAAPRSSGGSTPGSRSASIVLPAPGGPTMSRW